MLRLFLLRWLATRTLGAVIAGALGGALPLAILLKFVGVPVLAAVGIVGAPIGVALAVLRLPRAIVLGVVGLVGTLAAAACALGVFALKVGLLLIAAGLAARWMRRRARRAWGPAMGPIV